MKYYCLKPAVISKKHLDYINQLLASEFSVYAEMNVGKTFTLVDRKSARPAVFHFEFPNRTTADISIMCGKGFFYERAVLKEAGKKTIYKSTYTLAPLISLYSGQNSYDCRFEVV